MAARTGVSSGGSFGNNRGAGGDEIGNGLVFVEAQMAGVGADKALIEDAAGKLVEVVLLEGDMNSVAILVETEMSSSVILRFSRSRFSRAPKDST